MVGSDEKVLYKKGKDMQLDQRLARYKKLNVYAGNAVTEVLSKKERKLLVDLWHKERLKPSKMYVQEISTLVELSERIVAWRKRCRREKTRIRVERLRRKR